MGILRYSISITLDGCCDHCVIPADEVLHRHASENLRQADAPLIWPSHLFTRPWKSILLISLPIPGFITSVTSSVLFVLRRDLLTDSRGFLEALIDDGRPLITLTGLCLGLSGAFALMQSASGHFLPHDVAYLQMSPQDLCGINECRIVHFMFHDRVSFGGSLITLAVIYLWLAAFPLKAGERWAWWALCISGVSGFGSFLSYLGYGYLDSWHAVATAGLLPCFALGMYLTHRRIVAIRDKTIPGIPRTTWLHRRGIVSWRSNAGAGCVCLLTTAAGLIGAGMTILSIGMTEVFVPTDLTYMSITRAELDQINPRLIPLIAHDRAGFGGAVATIGLLLFACVWNDGVSRSLWQALLIAGTAGWAAAIGGHPLIGYTDPIHLAPAVTGAFLYSTGLVLTFSATKSDTISSPMQQDDQL